MAIYSHRSIVTAYGDPYQVFMVQFLVDEWTGTIVTETDETVDAQFFSLDDPPEPVHDSYHEAVEDLKQYDGKLILK